MFIIAGRDTTIALDAAFGVTEKFHSCHGSTPFTLG
jgi:hypothetical protein